MKKSIIVIAFLALSLGLVISFRMPMMPSLAAARATEADKYLYLPAVMNKYAPPTSTPTPTATATATPTPTYTPTMTPTPTLTSTSTSTPTQTATSSPTSSPSPSSTPTVTSSPTSSPSPTNTPTATPSSIPLPHCIYPIPGGTTLCEGYDMGVDDSANRRDWLSDMEGYMRMSYPGGLSWGAVFITVGPPVNPPRPGQDLSMYNTLSLELRGSTGNECVKIGIKDNTDLDNGTEKKVRTCVTSTNWETFTFTLSVFNTADLTRLYVVTEFVFDGSDASAAKTVDFRNIQYLFLSTRAANQSESQFGLRVP